MHLGNWLRSLGLERYEAAFRDNAIDEAILRDLKEDHLRELGLPLGARMKVLVCGGGDFEDWSLLSTEMTSLLGEQKIEAIIHGGARGADGMAGEFANTNNIREMVFEADWKKHGRKAGQCAISR